MGAAVTLIKVGVVRLVAIQRLIKVSIIAVLIVLLEDCVSDKLENDTESHQDTIDDANQSSIEAVKEPNRSVDRRRRASSIASGARAVANTCEVCKGTIGWDNCIAIVCWLVQRIRAFSQIELND